MRYGLPLTLAMTFSMLWSRTSVVFSAVMLTGWLLKTSQVLNNASRKDEVHTPCEELILGAECQLAYSTSA